MTSRYCDICGKTHYLQAYRAEPPRRETLTDWVVALGTWTVIIGAYVAAIVWAASR